MTDETYPTPLREVWDALQDGRVRPEHAAQFGGRGSSKTEALRLYMTTLGGGKSYLGRCAVRLPSWVAWRVDMGRMSKAATASERRQVSWRRVF